jgi:uncharacterized protein
MEALIIFTKSTKPGASKTRLAASIGEAAAAQLANAFVQDTARVAELFLHSTIATDVRRVVIYAAADAQDDAAVTKAAAMLHAPIEAQAAGHLGERMQAAFDQEWRRGARAICIIGTDAPTLPSHFLDLAFRALRFAPVVIGPAFDDGYWLLGANTPNVRCFDHAHWSTRTVMPATLALLSTQQVTPHLLPFWYDVDTDDDVKRLRWQCDPSSAAHTHAVLQSLPSTSTGSL